ncbi:MFS transporter [Streptomyces sp. HC44]|uniref:MFS transporter n=1 Tax=Streptomyces scabichelini TaxID=2711217 RepID=A0A6G4V827_9ACTN|nr:MFS transporter [Streptomyces scabichelini]NGO10268.1 MFS transporter [Streptomyces scabichelini]
MTLMLGAFVALLDVSIVTVALPDIGSDLDTRTSGMQWVVDAYILPLSALLLTSGVISDLPHCLKGVGGPPSAANART